MNRAIKVVEAMESMFERSIAARIKQLDSLPNSKREILRSYIEGRIQEMKDSLKYLKEMKSIWEVA